MDRFYGRWWYLILFLTIRFRERIGIKVVKTLKRGDDGVTHAAVDMLAALMQVSPFYISWTIIWLVGFSLEDVNSDRIMLLLIFRDTFPSGFLTFDIDTKDFAQIPVSTSLGVGHF